MTARVMALHYWADNAQLIADVANLGYMGLDDDVVDLTYGRGKWWDDFKPNNLVKHDKFTGPAKDGVDFRDTPHPDGSFHMVAFDPPYVSKGGRKTTTMPDFEDRYGMTDAPKTPAGVQMLINDGLTEAARLSRKYVMCKVQNYISSGKFWNGTYYTERHAIEELGLEVVERFEHASKHGRPQPEGKFVDQEDRETLWVPRKQRHARRNLSTLFIFQKPKEPRL